jgi:hypothetical protein
MLAGEVGLTNHQRRWLAAGSEEQKKTEHGYCRCPRPTNCQTHRIFPCVRTSGCFFNGLTQVCFFEPVLPLFFFTADFGPFVSGFGFGGDFFGMADDLNSLGTTQPGITGPADADKSAAAGENSWTEGGATVDTAAEAANEAARKGFFLLVLKDGTSHAVMDYWLTDGYLEYVSLDSTRSHVPLEALDLQTTVAENSRRGLRFELRSAPMDTH